MGTGLDGMVRAHDANGAAMAAVVASGIGAFAMGVVVLLGEAGLFAAPALYAPAGGVSGRTTLATMVWLAAWVLLHVRWRRREIAPGFAAAVTFTLTVLGVLATWPPLWRLFERP